MTDPMPSNRDVKQVGTLSQPALSFRMRASIELAASIRRSAELGFLAAAEVPWQILLVSYLQELRGVDENEQAQLAAIPSRMHFDRRWLSAVGEAGLIRIDSNQRFTITDHGVRVVQKCIGN